jgi:hypothetical protein
MSTIAPYSKSAGLGKSLIIVGPLRSAICYNTNAATRYLQLHDAVAVPANTSVPVMCVQIPTKSTGSIDFSACAAPASGSWVAVLSTTDVTLTITTTDDGLFMALKA